MAETEAVTSTDRLRFGAAAAGLAFAIAVLGGLPGRWAYALNEARAGKSLWQFFVLGLAVDGYSNGTIVGIGALAILLLCSRLAPRITLWACGAWVTLLWVLLFLGGIAATEFRLQRGLYPTFADLRAVGDRSYWIAAFGTLWLDRYLYPCLVAVPLAVGCFILTTRRWRSEYWRRWSTVAGYASFSALLFLAGWSFWFFSARVLPDVIDRNEVTSTFGSLVPFGAVRNVRWGLRRELEALPYEAVSVADGARMLGIPPDAATKLASGRVESCEPHPFRRAWPADELESVKSGRLEAGESYRPELVGSMLELSRSLFGEGAPRPVHVWHLLLEGLRADDVHALHPRAPREIAPFMNALYEGKVDGYRVLVARRMHQAGVRTSQGLAATVCGLGSMPYDLSFARDLGVLPARCLTDILAESGFDTSFVYGESPSFDNMLDFLQGHGVRDFVVPERLPPHAARSGWGVSDLALVRELFPLRASTSSSAYTLVLTLTNHHPFRKPDDMPVAVEERVARATSSTRDDDGRLLTYSYTDEAAREFFRQLESSPWAKRSIVVLAADHSTNDPLAWDKGDAGPALSHIPFVIAIPNAWLEGLRDAKRARAALEAASDELTPLVLSQNDVAAMMLALLTHAPELSGLAADKRWHTLGGQRTSPHFRADSLGRPPAWGINSIRQVFMVDSDGSVPTNGELSLPVIGDPAQAAPSLDPIAALLSAFLDNYDPHCRLVPNKDLQ